MSRHFFSAEAGSPRLSALAARANGFTLIELLVVMAIVGILVSIAALNVGRLRQPADEAARALNSTLGVARARAISTTSAVKVERLASSKQYTVQTAASCDAKTWTALSALTFTLPTDVSVSQPTSSWTACFTSRGVLEGASALPTVTLTDKRAKSRTLTVYAGGALEVK